MSGLPETDGGVPDGCMRQMRYVREAEKARKERFIILRMEGREV